MIQPKSPSDFRDGCKIFGVGAVISVLFLGGAAWVYPKVGQQPTAPTEITAAELGKVSRPEELPAPWLAVQFEKVVPTELATIDAVSNRVEHRYVLVEAGERWLLAAVRPDFQGNRFEGYLRTIPAFEFDDMFAATKDTHQGKLMPFQFDAVPHPGEDLKYLLYGLLGASAFGALFMVGGTNVCVRSYFKEPSEPENEGPSFGSFDPFAASKP